ncbi:MAG: hypothetical protein GY866_15510 [Proteobacteria bacterium]|nr:hypothetical protein [Pseudomonadota bacterium]
MPKWFQRVRYYGLEATKTYKKWAHVIQEGIKRLGRKIKGVYQIVKSKKYRQRYKEISGIDPMTCRYCGNKMELFKIWHPDYGVIYDEFENIKSGKYEPAPGDDRGGGGHPLRSTPRRIQLPLFPVPA